MAQPWDPARYLRYADERARPFIDLVRRIGAGSPATVVDLGCGPGNLTELLAERWPDADVLGVDSSPEMITEARQRAGRPGYELADLSTWSPAGRVDVIVSNAALQWVPGHLQLLATLVADLRAGGWLAFGVPGNFDAPSHTLRRQLMTEPPYAGYTTGLSEPDAHDAATYLAELSRLGCTVDAWETTYLHVLQGADAVFDWISSTSARPALSSLPADLRTGFAEELRRRLRSAYPDRGHGVVLPFRRVFVVAQVPR